MTKPTHTPDTQALDLDAVLARAVRFREYGGLPIDAEPIVTEDVPAMAAEIRRLRTELATARVQSLRDLADKADPQRPDISFFGDHGHEVGAWIRKQAEYEERRLAAAGVVHVVADGSDDPEHIDDCPGCEPAAPAVRSAAERTAVLPSSGA
jgi:hypothetical protein